MENRKIALRRWSLFMLFWSMTAIFGGKGRWQYESALAVFYVLFFCVGASEYGRRLVESDIGFIPLAIALLVFCPPFGVTAILIWLAYRKKHCQGEVLVMPAVFVWKVIPAVFLIKLVSEALFLTAGARYREYVSMHTIVLFVLLYYALFLYLPLTPRMASIGRFAKKWIFIPFFLIMVPYVYKLALALACINGLSWDDFFSGEGWRFVLGYSPDVDLLYNPGQFLTSLEMVGKYGLYFSGFPVALLCVALIILLLKKKCPPIRFTAILAVLLLATSAWFVWLARIIQAAGGNLTPDMLRTVIRHSWRYALPALLTLDVFQMGAKAAKIDLGAFHPPWNFLTINRDISLENKLTRGFVLALTVFIVLSLIVICLVNMVGISQVINGTLPPVSSFPPSGNNAFDIMEKHFRKKTSPDFSGEFPRGRMVIVESSKAAEREAEKEALKKDPALRWKLPDLTTPANFTPEEKKSLFDYWEENREGLEDFRRAADAGVYVQHPRNVHWILGEKAPHFKNIRSAAQCYATRAEIAIAEGRVREAMEFGTVLVRFGGMLMTEGLLVQRMAGVAVRGIGFNVFEMCFYARDLDDEGVERLYETMRALLGPARRGAVGDYWGWMGIPDYEVGLKWPARISLVAVIAIPGMEKAYSQLCFQTMRFDSLYLATACRLYRARHGHYPETSADLIPEFLPLWPKGPYSRKPYIFETNGDRLTIRTVQPEIAGSPFVRLDFPKLEIQEEEAEKEKPE